MKELWSWLNSFFPLIERGGWVMWPILVCSLISLAIILERFWFLVVRANRIAPRELVRELEALLEKGDVDQAIVACRKSDSMLARVLLAGLYRAGEPREKIREALENAGRREARELDRFLGTLAAIAGVSPLLGLFGTVLGMIRIFEQIATEHIGQYESLAEGIYIALYTTAAGLIVAIPSYLAYRGFQGLADRRASDMEDLAAELLDRLDREQDRKTPAQPDKDAQP